MPQGSDREANIAQGEAECYISLRPCPSASYIFRSVQAQAALKLFYPVFKLYKVKVMVVLLVLASSSDVMYVQYIEINCF